MTSATMALRGASDDDEDGVALTEAVETTPISEPQDTPMQVRFVVGRLDINFF